MQGNSHNDAHIRGNFSKETENLKKSHAELKTTVTEVKNTVEGMDRRLWGAEERISVMEGREQENREGFLRVKGAKRVCDNSKQSSICMIGVPEGEEGNRGIESMFEVIIPENLSIWGKK